jgi:hypothetical protein
MLENGWHIEVNLTGRYGALRPAESGSPFRLMKCYWDGAVHLAAAIGASRNFDMLCGRREPGAQVVWDAQLQSLLRDGHKHVLHESFSKLNLALVPPNYAGCAVRLRRR